MAKVFVHLVSGPEHPTRATLALLVARTAADEGHEVQLFLAGDAVQLVRPETAAEVHGVGTGSFAELWDALAASGVPIYLSGMSSKARGIEASVRPGQVEVSTPHKLVELAAWADTVLTY